MKYYLYHIRTDRVCKYKSQAKHDFSWQDGGLEKGSLISLKRARYIILYVSHAYTSTSNDFQIIKP